MLIMRGNIRGKIVKKVQQLCLVSCLSIITAACIDNAGDTASDTKKSNRSPLLVEKSTTGTVTDGAGYNWATYGGTTDENHYSSLTQIDNKNVGKLGLFWSVDLPPSVTTGAAPLAVDGVLYAASGLSVVRAINAANGEMLWTYDPGVASVAGDKLKLAWGIRGLGYWDNKIYIGTQDGRLLNLDAKNGELLWSVETTEVNDGRFITGAPRLFNGMVIIGHGGADHSPVRGYVTAYDAITGEQRWRFYTVPGNPADGFEDKAQELAAKTWTGEWWKFGGGGTAWNAITFDEEFNRIYVGTGNGAPWNREIRSPEGGDNLFLCSIVALDADTGEYVWHYQTTPGESWDYNSAMDIELATLEIDNSPRKVILHAPKNGFFYVIDRETGKLISADPFAKVTWASGVDLETGRPIETPEARDISGVSLLSPSALGAHNWQPMSYSQSTGYVYIPTTDLPFLYDTRGIDPKTWIFSADPALSTGYVENELDPPADPPSVGLIQAWDPVNQKRVWSDDLRAPINGGIISTAGNVVFQGQADGYFVARDALTGDILWRFFAENGIIGQPISYMVNGRQQVTVVTGFGGPAANLSTFSAQFGWDYHTQKRRILTFVLNGGGELASAKPIIKAPYVIDPEFNIDAKKAKEGAELYQARCFYCHGAGAMAGGSAPDLRRSTIPASAEAFKAVVRRGVLQKSGMPAYPHFSDSDLGSLRHFIGRQARKAK